jgi:ABC-type sugar transport system ATPase subunit
MNEYLVLQDVVKDFGYTRALDRVSFAIREGEIHGLVGENGAGKSTAAKLISGDLRETSGRIRLKGEVLSDLTPQKARENGITIVHQWGDLAPNLSVLENIFLGNEIKNRWGILNNPEMRKRAEGLLKDFGLDIKLDSIVSRIVPS